MPLRSVLIILGFVALALAAMLVRALREDRKNKELARARQREKKERKRTSDRSPPVSVPKLHDDEDDPMELTRFSVTLDGESDEITQLETVVPIIYDDEAAVDLPTQTSAFILVHAVGQSDRGKRRKRNEDSFLVMDQPPLFVVADGMGGYAGGDVASLIAVTEAERMFQNDAFDESAFYKSLPRRAAELVQAIQTANRRIWEESQQDEKLSEMGTTVVAARFSPNKQRVYLGHVGDSRCYVLRDGRLKHMTTDHTAAQQGVKGPLGATLTRVLGIDRKVVVDLILGEPRDGDRYVLCSDGLSKMLTDDQIAEVLEANYEPDDACNALIDAANEEGGRDNVTVIVVDVQGAPTASMKARNNPDT